MNEGSSQHEALISRYMDGLMSEGEASAFRAKLASDAELRGELALQEAIAGSLKRTLGFAPGAVVGVKEEGGGAAGGEHADASDSGRNGSAAGSRNVSRIALKGDATVKSGGAARTALKGGATARRWLIGAAAAAAVLVAGGVIAWQAGAFAPPGVAQELYALKAKDGFAYKWACDSEEDFIAHTTAMFNQPLVADASEEARIVGWDYLPESWDPTVGLLVAKVDGADVLVVIEPPGCKGKRVRPEAGRGLTVFTRRLGRVVIYEITPLEHSAVLELFRIP